MYRVLSDGRLMFSGNTMTDSRKSGIMNTTINDRDAVGDVFPEA